VTDPTPAAGWYPDPHAPGFLRWWDGTQWTHHTAPIPSAPPAAPPYAPPSAPSWSATPSASPYVVGPSTSASVQVADQRRPGAIIGIIAGAALVVGSFLPWVRASLLGITLSRSGIDAGDGWFTFIAGGVVIAVCGVVLSDPTQARRGLLILALLASAVALLVGIVDWADVQDTVEESDGIARVGAGLYLVVVAAVASTGATAWCLARPPATPAPTA
jgi:hypothetical protein